MALVPTLTITDTTTFSDEISFSVTDSLTVTAPSQGLTTIIATATGGSHVILPAASGVRYFYLRHTGTTDGSTGTAQLVDVENADNVAVARLGAGEWCFFPIAFTGAASKAFQLQVAHASNVQMEYAYWTKG